MPTIDAKTIQELKELQPDPKFMVHLVNEFAKQISEITQAIQVGLKAKKATEVASAAHKFKSSSRQLGALKLSELCLQLEKAGKEGLPDLTQAEQWLAQIKLESAEALKELKSIVSK